MIWAWSAAVLATSIVAFVADPQILGEGRPWLIMLPVLVGAGLSAWLLARPSQVDINGEGLVISRRRWGFDRHGADGWHSLQLGEIDERSSARRLAQLVGPIEVVEE